MYHLHVKNITRTDPLSGNRVSAVAKAAYRAGERLENAFEQRMSDFTSRTDVVHTEIILPDGAPAWMADRVKLWTAVDAAEFRKDSRLAREVEFALPRALPKKEWIEVTRSFAKHFSDQGLVVDIAIHDDGTRHNPHVHLMMTTRKIDGDGFGQKNRAINAKTFVIRAREQWASIANASLEAVGSPLRIDPRSNDARGIKEPPSRHRGPNKHERQRRRIERSEHMRELPVVRVEIAPFKERDYYRDDKAEEFRAVDDPKERIAFDDPRVESHVGDRTALVRERKDGRSEPQITTDREDRTEEPDIEERDIEADLRQERSRQLRQNLYEHLHGDPMLKKREAREDEAQASFERDRQKSREWEEYDPQYRIDMRGTSSRLAAEEAELQRDVIRDGAFQQDGHDYREDLEPDPDGRPIHREDLQKAQERMLEDMERKVSDREERDMREERDCLAREREERRARDEENLGGDRQT